MSNTAILVEGLGKQYHIGGPQKQFDRLGDQMLDALAAPLRRAKKLLRGQATGAAELDETFWALQDISFEVAPGEVVGVIGRNGAGKSTLLKILSRITEPTSGYARISGRVGSLLEVGTGFHPELTGRENVFLNGAILGMKRGEIENKFDEIVAFAEIDKFIDTPVKHYSSGMYVRLAFAVAAHLEPEILLVDEVLAVGDQAFQRKCLGKMDNAAQEGRTVLFVSHNMGLMQALCQRGILLQEGAVLVDSTMTDAIDAYLAMLEEAEDHDLATRTDRKGQGRVRLLDVDMGTGIDGSRPLKTGEPAIFRFRVNNLLPGMVCDFRIFDKNGQPAAAFKSKFRGPQDIYNPTIGRHFVCEIDRLFLVPGRYRIDIAVIADNKLQDYVEAATYMEVGAGLLDGRAIQEFGQFSVSMPHRWQIPSRD